MKRENCRVCGRWGIDDDTSRCRQTQDQSGEYYCPGDGPVDHDDEGFFLYHTPEEEVAMEAHWDRVIRDAEARGEL